MNKNHTQGIIQWHSSPKAFNIPLNKRSWLRKQHCSFQTGWSARVPHIIIYSDIFLCMYIYKWASQAALVVKKPRVNAGDLRDSGSTPGSRKSLAGRYGNPLQSSCPENPMDRGAWRTTVHRVKKSRMQLNQLIVHSRISFNINKYII